MKIYCNLNYLFFQTIHLCIDHHPIICGILNDNLTIFQLLDELQKMPWTGNIRELRNVVERLAILCDYKVTGADVIKFAQPLIK